VGGRKYFENKGGGYPYNAIEVQYNHKITGGERGGESSWS